MSQASIIQNQDQPGDSSADASASAPGQWLGISNQTWVRISIIGALMTALFWFNLRRLWDKTNPFYGEANWGHAIAIPFIGLYYLYVNRDQLIDPRPAQLNNSSRTLWTGALVEAALVLNLLWIWVYAPELMNKSMLAVASIGAAVAAFFWKGRGTSLDGRLSSVKANQVEGNPTRRSAILNYADSETRIPTRLELIIERLFETSATWFGGYLMVFGIALFVYGIYPGQNDFVKDFGMLVTLMGITIMMAGWERMKIAWFAVAFLVCGIPWPGLVYSRIASPLQFLAAQVAVWTLEMTGVESSASGTKIQIAGQHGLRTLNVAEACAGLRSLMTFITVGASVAFLSSRPLWQKIIVTVSAIPIAIFCNVMRVAGQGLLDHYVSQQLADGFAHQFVGMIMLIPAFVLILLVGWVLDQIFYEEVDRRHRKAAPTAVIRQRGQTIAAPVAAGSGRSLASIKAAAIQTKPAIATTTPPPPSARLASRPPAARGTSAPQASVAKKPPAPKPPPGTLPGKAV